MSTKDIAEKHLLNHAEIFADIINVLLFHGKQVVNENDLQDSKARTQLKIDGGLHEQERDVVKYWEKCGVRIALLGLENQTYVDDDMPLRVLSYDGAHTKSKSISIPAQNVLKIKNPYIHVLPWSFILAPHAGTEKSICFLASEKSRKT